MKAGHPRLFDQFFLLEFTEQRVQSAWAKPNPSMGFPGHKFGDFNSAPLLFEKGHKNIEHGLRQRAAFFSAQTITSGS